MIEPKACSAFRSVRPPIALLGMRLLAQQSALPMPAASTPWMVPRRYCRNLKWGGPAARHETAGNEVRLVRTCYNGLGRRYHNAVGKRKTLAPSKKPE